MSQEKSQRNRRLSLRRTPKSRIKATCRKGGMDLGPNLAAATLNVSECGVRLLLSANLLHGQEVSLSLEGQDHLRPLRLLGNVVWCRSRNEQWEVGIQFQKRLRYQDVLRLT
jgi:hypothetical protein